MNLKQKKKMLSALLAFTMVLQMSVPLVFAEMEDSLSGADDIMLSGSNQPTTTGGAITIDLDGLVAGNLDSLNEGDKVTIDGKEVTYKGDATATGINIAQSEYVADGKQVIYKAGNGYILITWPTQAGGSYLVTLHDANIDIADTGDIDAINIFGKLDITLEGENILKAPRNAINSSNSSPKIILRGDGLIDMESSLCGVRAEMGYVTIQDNVVLSSKGAKWGVVGGYYEDVLIKDNAKIHISVRPDESNFENYAIRCGNLYVKGDARVDTNGEHPFISTRIGVEVDPTASLNAIVRGVLGSTYWAHTVYGTVTILENITADFGASVQQSGPFSAAEGASLINNGTIKIKQDISLEQLKALNITNNGIIMLGSNPVQLFGDTLYEDRGEITGDFDFKTNITTEPTYYRKSGGYIMFRPASGVENAVLTLHGVNLEEYNDLLILPDEPVDVIIEGENEVDIIRASKNFNLKGSGTLNALRIETTEEDVQMNKDSNVKLNTEYRTGSNMIMTSTFYGKNEVAYQGGLVVRDDQKVVLKSGSELKLLGQGFMQIEEGALGDIIIEEGASIVNNSHIFLPIGTTIEQIKALNLKGAGAVRIVKSYDNGNPSVWDTYTNEGKPIVEINGNLTLRDTEVTEADNQGYTWTKKEEQGSEIWTLTLKNILLTGNLDIPNRQTIIDTQEDSVINGSIETSTWYPMAPIFIGKGILTINGDISGAVDGDTVTVKDGAKLNVHGRISIGGSGGSNGTVNVIGVGTVLDITSASSTGIYTDTVNIGNGATLNVKSTGYRSVGVSTISGVNITQGSTLRAGCDYGVYVSGGSLVIDDTSKLITDAAVAPFCIVDKTTSKSESEAIKLPAIPDGTQITSVIGTDAGYGYKYWSLVPTSGSLGVSEENNDVATLTGAMKGLLTFAKNTTPTTPTTPTNPSNPSDGGGGSSSNNDKKDSEKSSTSITPITIVKAEQTNPTFIDINDSDWFKPAVDFVTGKGIMNGIEKNRFGPNISTTRGMIVTIFWQMENKPMPNDSQNYADVNQGQYFADAVNWATENNIVVGYGNGNFGPNDTIAREQMATILYQYCKYKNYDLNQGGMSTREFSDYENISPWALEYMTWAVNNQIISGVGNNMLNSRGHATRAQVAAILKNFYSIIDKQ
ncbi:S-layer homology domain-containing protein [Acetoanaerobium noterae]|uniref:S-layer homology domain-containing protein n=1 Tax=Acetoanaerobium noterae TaxID=745369 RepID=UPI0033191CE1